MIEKATLQKQNKKLTVNRFIMKKAFIISSIYFLIVINISAQSNLNEEIIGRWSAIDLSIADSEEETDFIWVFTEDGICNWIKSGEVIFKYNYSISNYSCNNKLDNKGYSHLKLINKDDLNDIDCFVIEGTVNKSNSIYLSVTNYNTAEPILFKKIVFDNQKELPDDKYDNNY